MEAVVARSATWRTVVPDLFEMTKPKVQSLLLFTTVTTMYVAGDPSLGLVALTCLGGALSAGGAGAINHALDRDIDGLMSRTANRPVASGRISPAAGLAFGITLGVAAFVLLASTVNLLAAALSLSGLLGYVFVYTLWLKRSTPQNIVIGGAAGAVPPLVGWAAVTGSLDLTALYLFLIIFYWTPPHFWALALLKQADYGRAGVPMAPLVWGERETMRQMLWYTVILVPLTLLPGAFGAFGAIYLASATVLGGILVWGIGRVMRAEAWIPRAWWVYKYSLLYLALLFVAMVADRALLG